MILTFRTSVSLLLAMFTIAMVLPLSLSAQTEGAGTISLTLSPEFPGPRQKVTATLTSYATNLDTAAITWTVGGKTALSGKGEKRLSFTTGDVGILTSVSASITPPGEATVVKKLSVVPGRVDLVWEAADSYVPPFYRGKALPSPEGIIRVIALPDMRSGGVKLKAENLIYRWKRNLKAETSASGFGKNSFSFKTGFAESEAFEVTVNTVEGTPSAAARGFAVVGSPLVMAYEDRPLEGVHYEEVLPARLALDNEEIKVHLEPYFFSGTKNTLSYVWRVNGEETAAGNDGPYTLTLRVPEAANGIASLVYSVIHPRNLLQSKEGGMLIQFQETR